jgi:hypothetical protein
LLSGVRPGHQGALTQLGVYDELAHERLVFGSTPETIAHARDHVRKIAH